MDWERYQQIAQRFQYKVKLEDKEDIKQDIIVRLAEVETNNGHKPFTEGSMMRVASYVVKEYWHNLKRKPMIVSLNSNGIQDEDGNSIELWETLADDKAIDLEAWQDAKTWLLGCPERLVSIAHKKLKGIALSEADMIYLCRWRKANQKQLELAAWNNCN